MITNFTTSDRIEQLKKIAPIRERAFRDLSTLRKARIDHRTVILMKK